METKSVFAVLNAVNCNEHTEEKNGLTFLSWAWAWAKVKEHFPTANYTIYETVDGCNYFTDGRTCWVKTGVTIEGLEHIEYLPVMDFRNQSIPFEKVTSFDVNKTIQRSLTKACARHGLGLYIYAGEDLPEGAKNPDYKPMEEKAYKAIISAYARNKKTKTGGDYRETWIEQTSAGSEEIKMFDKDVAEYRKAHPATANA